MEFKLTAPVLLIAFNRPDTTEQVFQKIREAKPQKLYVAVDGARQSKEGEEELVSNVKKIVENVDWQCDVKYKYNETNKGAEITVSSAITWALESEEYVIILEDDIIAPLSFFRFAQEMLIKYKDNENIGLVSGCNFTPLNKHDENDYYFVKYAHSWGWATWKRMWNKFNLYAEVKEEHLRYDYLKKISNTKAEAIYYKNKFKNIKNKGRGNSTWDSIGGYILRTNNYINIIPRVNLTSNIGVYGLHAIGKTEHHFRSYDENFIVKKHPDKIELNAEYDMYHFNNYINKNKKHFIIRLVKKMLKILKLK